MRLLTYEIVDMGIAGWREGGGREGGREGWLG